MHQCKDCRKGWRKKDRIVKMYFSELYLSGSLEPWYPAAKISVRPCPHTQKNVTPSHTHPEKCHTHPHPPRKMSHPPTPTQKNITPTHTYLEKWHTHPQPPRKISHVHTHPEKCHIHLHPPRKMLHSPTATIHMRKTSTPNQK